MRRVIAAVITAMMMLSSTALASFDINVAFDNENLNYGENGYNVFGTNDTDADQDVQIISVTYEDGKMKNVDVSESYVIPAGAEFDFSGNYTVPNGLDLINSDVRLFAWDSTDGIRPLTEAFSPNIVSFEYTLEEDAKTSAGVYDEENRLIRTLWSAEEKTAGTHTAYWDGKNDNGALMEDGDYHVIVMSNNVEYEMYTLVGNTSERVRAEEILSDYKNICDMTVLGDRMYYTNSYMENSRTWPYFELDNIHRVAGFYEPRGNRITSRNCTDGTYIYHLNYEIVPTNYIDPEAEYYQGGSRVFVSGFDPSEDKHDGHGDQIDYAAGRPLNSFWGGGGYYDNANFRSALAVRYVPAGQDTTRKTFGDIAVQQNGNYLFFVNGFDDCVIVIDKTTGYTVEEYPLYSPGALAIDKNDNIWVSYKNGDGTHALSLFNVGSDGKLSLAKTAPASVSTDEILALAIAPDGNNLLMAYGFNIVRDRYGVASYSSGTNTGKVMSYNTNDWSLNWTLGTGERYDLDPHVYDDKFLFGNFGEARAIGYDIQNTFLTFESDNILWLGDSGNERCLKYDMSTGKPVLIDRICAPMVCYAATIDANDPTRVFHGSMEYEMDYSVEDPEKSWKPKRNWVFQAKQVERTIFDQINAVTTFENGRTFFAGYEYTGSSDNRRYLIYEMTDTEIINTGIDITGYTVLSDGKMTLQRGVYDLKHNGYNGNGFYQKYLTGFDKNGYPVWSDEVLLAFISDENRGNFWLLSSSAYTSTGMMVAIDAHNKHSKTDLRDMHMAGMVATTEGNPSWSWKANPATGGNYNGDFPRDGTYEVNSWYTWTDVRAYGRNLLSQYRGEGYKAGQTNIYYHMYDNGLLVGVFGEALHQRALPGEYGQELVSGNAFCWVLSINPDKPDEGYLIAGGEARLSGVLVRKITGLESIKEHFIPIKWESGQRNGFDVSYYSATGTSSTELVSSDIVKTAQLTGGFPAGAEQVVVKGYVTKPDDADDLTLQFNSDGYMKVYLDYNLKAEGSGTINQVISPAPGEKVKVEVVVTPNNGIYNDFSITYQSSSGQKPLTSESVWTEPKVYEGDKTVRNLLEDLPYDVKIHPFYEYIWGEIPYQQLLRVQELNGWDLTNWFAHDITRNYGYTNVLTNARSYDSYGEHDNDLYLSVQLGNLYDGSEWWEAAGEYSEVYADRTLGDVREDLVSWEIDANVMFAGPMTGEYTSENTIYSGPRGSEIQILDENDKIIAKVYPGRDYFFYGNDTKVFQATLRDPDWGTSIDDLHEFTDQSPLNIYAENGQITFTYRGASTTTGVYDQNAQWDKPAKLRVYVYEKCHFWAHGVTYTVDFSKLQYTQYGSGETYTVNFYDKDGTLLASRQVAHGNGAPAPKTGRDGNPLTWDKDFSYITSNLDVHAR